MRKVASLGLGFAIGALIGAVLVLVFAPATGDKLRGYLREGYDETLAEAKTAAAVKRAELEADLARRVRRS